MNHNLFVKKTGLASIDHQYRKIFGQMKDLLGNASEDKFPNTGKTPPPEDHKGITVFGFGNDIPGDSVLFRFQPQ